MRIFVITTIAYVSGCSLAIDLDRFSQEQTSNDLSIELQGFEEFDGQTLQVRLFTSLDDTSSPVVVAKAVYEDFDPERNGFVMVGAAPVDENYLVDVFVDENENGVYDTDPEPEPGWTSQLLAGNRRLVFEKGDTEIFLDDPPRVDRNGDFDMTLTRMIGPHKGQHFELVVIHMPEQRVVGFYRLGALNTQDHDPLVVSVPGILDTQEEYQIDFYADAITDDIYSPAGDHRWRRMATAGEDGIDLRFDHDSNFDDVASSFPTFESEP